jgi:hypothetical protein
VSKERQSSPSAATSKPIAKKRKTKLELGDKVFEPTENDILYGRGGRTNTHPGNIRYRDKVLELKDEYKLLTKKEKKERNLPMLVVKTMKNEKRYFLMKDKDGLWYEVNDKGARE